MSQKIEARPYGRPKNQGKRTAIVDAARRLFVANPYDSVTMDQVAKAAGVAKMTVYGHFRDKESLFEAMMESTSDMLTASLLQQPGPDGDLEEELVSFGRTFLTVLLSPGVVASFYRHFDMLTRNRQMAERFYNSGPGRTRAMLAAYLISHAEVGNFSPEMSLEAASNLMSLWLGDIQPLLAMGLLPPITQGEITQRVSRGTTLFLRAYSLLPR